MLTHWSRHKDGRHFSDDSFKCIFLNENVSISLKFVPNGPINNIPALVQIMAWRHPGDKPLSEPMMVNFPMHICVTRPQWVKSNRCIEFQFRNIISMAHCKTAVSPLLTHWRYCSPALSHWFIVELIIQNSLKPNDAKWHHGYWPTLVQLIGWQHQPLPKPMLTYHLLESCKKIVLDILFKIYKTTLKMMHLKM